MELTNNFRAVVVNTSSPYVARNIQMDANRGTSGYLAAVTLFVLISISKILAYNNSILLNFNLVIGLLDRSDGDLSVEPGDDNTWKCHLMKSPAARNRLARRYKSMSFVSPSLPVGRESAAFCVALFAAASSSSQFEFCD